MERRPSLKVLLILLLVLQSTLSASPNKYLFTLVLNGVPYAILNDEARLSSIRSLLLTSFVNRGKDHGGPSIVLDTSRTETIYGLPLYDGSEEIRCAEITGPGDLLEDIIGFKPGDSLIVQPITPDGSGTQHIIEVASILFHPAGYFSILILKCKPVGFDTVQHDYPYVADHFFGWYESASLIGPSAPQAVRAAADSVASEYLPPTRVGHMPPVSIQPLRYLKETYFAFVASCSNCGDSGEMMGSVWLADHSGRIIFQSDSLYSRILGITGVARNNTHELILLWGNGRAGGVQVVCLEHDPVSGRPKAHVGQRFLTMWD